MKYSRLTMLWQFRRHSRATQPYLYMYPFSPNSLPIQAAHNIEQSPLCYTWGPWARGSWHLHSSSASWVLTILSSALTLELPRFFLLKFFLCLKNRLKCILFLKPFLDYKRITVSLLWSPAARRSPSEAQGSPLSFLAVWSYPLHRTGSPLRAGRYLVHPRCSCDTDPRCHMS